MTDINQFVKGALIGGAIAGVAGLLLAKKPGSMVVQDILDIYDSAQKKGCDFIDEIKEKGSCLTHFGCEEECEDHSALLIGGALGAVIGGVATLLLTPSSGKNLRKVLGKQYDDIRGQAEHFISSVEKKGSHAIHELSDWKDTLMDLISKLTNSSNTKKNGFSPNIEQILNLAQVGMHLYQKLNKGK